MNLDNFGMTSAPGPWTHLAYPATDSDLNHLQTT